MLFLSKPIRTKEKSFLQHFLNMVVFRIFIFKYLTNKEARQIPSAFSYFINFVFAAQIYFYVNYEPMPPIFCNQVYKKISAIFSFVNFELIWLNLNSGFGLWVAIALILVYFISLFFSIYNSFEVSNKKNVVKTVFDRNFRNLAIRVYSYVSRVFVACFGPTVVSFLIWNLKEYPDNTQLFGVLGNSNFFKLFFVFSVLGIIILIFELVLEIPLGFKEYDRQQLSSRIRNATYLFLIVFKYLLLVLSQTMSDFRNNLTYLSISFTGFSFIMFLVLFERTHFNLIFYKLNANMICFLFVCSWFSLMYKTTRIPDQIWYHVVSAICSIFLLDYFLEQRIFHIIEREIFSIEKLLVQKDFEYKNLFKLLSTLFFFEENQDRFLTQTILPSFILNKHLKTCKDVSCKCKSKDLDSDNSISTALCIEFLILQNEELFQTQCHNFEMISLKSYIFSSLQNHLIKGVVLFLESLPNLSGISNTLNLNLSLMDIGIKTIKTDDQNVQENDLSSLKIHEICLKIDMLQELVIKTVSCYKNILLEIINPNQNPNKIKSLTEDLVKLYKKTQKQFESNKSNFSQNYRNLYIYNMFLVNVMDDEAISNSVLSQLRKMNYEIDIVSQRTERIVQRFGENTFSSMFIVSGNKSNMMDVQEVYYNYHETLGYEKKEIINQSALRFMPQMISGVHDQFLYFFFHRGESKFLGNNRILPWIHKDGFLVPCDTILRLYPDINRGICFICFMTSELYEIRSQFGLTKSKKSEDIKFILFGENHKIEAIGKSVLESPIFGKEFLSSFQGPLRYNKFDLIELFPQLEFENDQSESFFQKKKTNLRINKNIGKIELKKTTASGRSMAISISAITDQMIECSAILIQLSCYYKDLANSGLVMFLNKSSTTQGSTSTSTNSFTDTSSEILHKSIEKNIFDEKKNDETKKPEKNTNLESPQIDFREIEEKKTKFIDKKISNFDFLIKLFSFLLYAATFVVPVSQNFTENASFIDNCEFSITKMHLQSCFYISANKAARVFGQMQNDFLLMANSSFVPDSLYFTRKQQEILKYLPALEGNSTDFEFDRNAAIQSTSPDSMISDRYNSLKIVFPSIENTIERTYNTTLNYMMSELISYVSQYSQLGLPDPQNYFTQHLLTDSHKLLSAAQDFNFVVYNLVNQIDLQIFDFYQSDYEKFEVVENSHFSTNRRYLIIFLVSQIILILFTGFFMDKFTKANDQFLLIVSMMDKDCCIEQINRCENFVEILGALEKQNIFNIEVSRQVMNSDDQKNLDQTANLAIQKSSARILDKSEEITPTNKPKKIKQILFCDKTNFVNKFLLVFVLLSSVLNITYFEVTNPVFVKLFHSIAEFQMYRDSNVCLFYAQYQMATNRRVNISSDGIANLIQKIMNNTSAKNTEFRMESNGVFSISFNSKLKLAEQNICLYIDQFLPELRVRCLNSTVSDILQNGLTTSFTYVMNQMNNYVINNASSSNSSSIDASMSLKSLRIIVDILEKVTNSIIQFQLNDFKSVIHQNLLGFYALLVYQAILFILFCVFIFPRISGHLKKQKEVCHKIFAIMNSKIILRSKKILQYLDENEMTAKQI